MLSGWDGVGVWPIVGTSPSGLDRQHIADVRRISILHSLDVVATVCVCVGGGGGTSIVLVCPPSAASERKLLPKCQA